MIIISASGMATGGRVLHHLRALPPRSNEHTILLVGYQAAGTRGRLARRRAPTSSRSTASTSRCRAQIVQLEGLSAHADYREIIDWLRASAIAPRRVFVTHGEPQAADGMRRRLVDELQWDAIVPGHGDAVDLT